MVMLYIDVLGMKARWQTGGVDAAKATYDKLGNVIESALAEASPEVQQTVTGGVQTDSAALVFAKPDDAIAIGRSIFKQAFALSNRHQRFWIRGLIRKVSNRTYETTTHLKNPADGVVKRIFSDDLLSAINDEQCGYRGQRLLLHEDLFTGALGHRCKTPVCHGWDLFFLKKLESSYDVENYRDVLWMFPDDSAHWTTERAKMSKRLQWASRSGSNEEFMHAAATQLVFEECQELVNWIQKQAPR